MAFKKYKTSDVMGRVCLAMIVANERPVIERCLNSVLHLIDQICISINEDLDGTQECIEEWGRAHNIPTIVWYDPWKGYGPNKTRNLAKIRAELETDYILFLDADEVFVTDSKDPSSYPTPEHRERLLKEMDSKPNTDCFQMKSHYGSHIYSRWQIIRNNQTWTWYLPFQECLEGDRSNNTSHITWMYNYVRHQGHSSRHDDITSNIKLLEGWLEDHPPSENRFMSRVLFYLGQACKESKRREKAIEYLEKRLKEKGWSQERYIACFYLADLYAKNDPDKQLFYLVKSVDIDPTRLEGYYKLMMLYKDKNNRKAAAWALAAPKSRIPPFGAFLINKPIYEYKFDFEFAVIAYYAARKAGNDTYEDAGLYKAGLDAVDRCMKKCPSSKRDLCISNRRFYVEKIAAFAPQTRSLTPLVKPGAHKNTTAIIIENFYEDPVAVRKQALSMPFGVKGNYPGARTVQWIPEGTKERIEGLVGDKITYWPKKYNGSFQYTLGNHKSWIHRDLTEWSLVVYLTPDAPIDGGTKLYIHKATGVTKSKDPVIEKQLNDDSNNHDAWDVLDKIGNRFNRAIMFKGENSHMSDQYFGTCLENGRLFQTFFFNTASYSK